MRLVWNGTVTSATRREPTSGLPTEYRLNVYDDGTATCTCAGYLFGGRSAPDRLRFRCKHLKPLFPNGVFRAPRTPADTAAELSSDVTVRPTVDRPAAPSVGLPADNLFDDDDDDDYRPGRIRR